MDNENERYNNSLLGTINSLNGGDCTKRNYEFYDGNFVEGNNYLLKILKYYENVPQNSSGIAQQNNIHECAAYCLLTGSENNEIAAMANIDITAGKCKSVFPNDEGRRRDMLKIILKHEIINNKCYLHGEGGIKSTALVLCIALLNKNILIRIDDKAYKNIDKSISMENNNNLEAIILDGHAVAMILYNGQLYIFDSLAQVVNNNEYAIDTQKYVSSFQISGYTGKEPNKLINRGDSIQQNSTCFLYCLSFLDLMTSNDQNVIAKRQHILNNIENVFKDKTYGGKLLVIENMLNMLNNEQKIVKISIDNDGLNIENNELDNIESTIQIEQKREICCFKYCKIESIKISDIVNTNNVSVNANINGNTVTNNNCNVNKYVKNVNNDTIKGALETYETYNDGQRCTRVRQEMTQTETKQYIRRRKQFNNVRNRTKRTYALCKYRQLQRARFLRRVAGKQLHAHGKQNFDIYQW